MTSVALDVMGADGGALPIVHGAAQLSVEDDDVHVILVGDGEQIETALRAVDHDSSKLSVSHTTSFVEMTDKPAAALDAKPDCSILQACRAVNTQGASARPARDEKNRETARRDAM